MCIIYKLLLRQIFTCIVYRVEIKFLHCHIVISIVTVHMFA
jgi:hypothetical protein